MRAREFIAEGLDAEAYKEHLIKTMPQMMKFLSKNVKGWRPSEEQMLSAIDTAYMVMKHTGDVKQAGKALQDELNTLHRMSQGQQGVAEAFDRPYKTKTEKSDYGDVDMLARLPDGTNLSIMFNNQGDDEWQVEFYRNNSQEVTGEGDAQRVFATVLTSMQKFIKKYKPWRLTFSANKDVQPGQNSESRAKLYNRLVRRYATAWGYEEYAEDHGDQITYELTRLKPGVAEEQLDELNFLGSECTKDCSGHRAGYDWSKRKGLRQANSWSPSFNKGAGLAVAGK